MKEEEEEIGKVKFVFARKMKMSGAKGLISKSKRNFRVCVTHLGSSLIFLAEIKFHGIFFKDKILSWIPTKNSCTPGNA